MSLERTDSLRVEIRFKNARLLNAILEDAAPDTFYNGMHRGSVASWGRAHGISNMRLYALLSLRITPYGRKQAFTPTAQCIAASLNLDPEWLFPRELYDANWPKALAIETTPDRFLPLSAAKRSALLLPATQEQDIDAVELQQQMQVAMQSLTSNEQLVIRQHFGFEDEKPKTLEEIAVGLNLSRERIRQIENKALRKLRRPKVSRSLQPFLSCGPER